MGYSVNISRTSLRLRWMALLLVSGMVLSGCTIFPGSKMSTRHATHESAQQDQKVASLPSLVHVFPLDTRLLTEIRQQPDKLPVLPASADEPPHYEYTVGVGDVLQVTVWDHPELTIPAGSQRSSMESGNLVHNDGTIFYPYVGKIKVEGLSVTDIREVITERLAKYIENPQVDVMVAGFRSQRVYVTGAVKQPGVVPISNIPLHLVDAINAAGGLDTAANWQDVSLIRQGEQFSLSLKSIYQQGQMEQNILLHKGDVINVGRDDDNKIFVMGEVLKPQISPMGRNGMSLAEALAGAGGINQMQADASGIFVLRNAGSPTEPAINVYQLNAKNATAFVLADQFEMQPRDIVYVTAAPIARWNRVIAQLLPTVQAVYYGSLAYDRIQRIDE